MHMKLTAARMGCAVFLALGLAGCSGPSADAPEAAEVGQTGAESASGGIPTLADLAPGYNMDGGTVLDLRGISLGMPRGEAFAKLKEYFPEATYFGASVGDLSGSDGYNRVRFPFDEDDETEATIDGTRDAMYIQYTTPISGERVMGVSRSLAYETQQPGFDEVLNGVIAKYGTPTYRSDAGNVVTLSYAWFEGKLAAPTTDAAMAEMEVGSLGAAPPADPDWCISSRGMTRFGYNLTYSDKEIIDKAPGCTVVLNVRLVQGKRPDLLYLADFQLMDYRRSFDNWVANSAWIAGEIAKVAASQGGAAAPAL